MKKIILILALLSLGVSKAQVVGGYLPLNSTKSATMGGLRVNGNETVTGTFSVGSTATVSGAFKGNSTIDGASYKMNGTAVVEVSNSRMVLSGGSYTAVEISGTKPLIMNSAVLTGGNTGTVAVLSDAVFSTTHFHSNASTVDNITFFFDKSLAGVSITSGVVGRTYLPYNCTLIGYSFESYVSGTLGSAGNATISVRIDNTTDVTLTSVHNYTALTNYNNASNLNTNITAGSYVEIKVVVPDIITAATNVSEYVTLYYVRRS